jgi:hypothetical protein
MTSAVMRALVTTKDAFSDIKTMDDVVRLQHEDPNRFQAWQVYQMRLQAAKTPQAPKESPGLQALANAKAMQEATAFGRWCLVKGVRCLPAMPAHVAAFVRDCEPIIEKLCAALKEVSQSHVDNGYADPTAGGQVADACNAVAKIDAPRSWPSAEKQMFERLPYHIQFYLAEREQQRDKAVRHAQNEAAEARQAIAAIQQPKEKSNGIRSDA